MKILENNHRDAAERTVTCSLCLSKLAITEADIRPVNGQSAVLCPCCHKNFPCMTEQELTQAYYNK